MKRPAIPESLCGPRHAKALALALAAACLMPTRAVGPGSKPQTADPGLRDALAGPEQSASSGFAQDSAAAVQSYSQGRYAEAVERAARALTADPGDQVAFATLRLAQARLQPPAEPEAAPSRSELLKDEYQDMVLQQAEVEDAQRRGELGCVGEDPLVGELVKQAAAKIAFNDFWGAAADASRALRLDVRSGPAFYLRSVAYNLGGSPARAVRDASAAVAIAPQWAGGYEARARAFLAQNRLADAISDAGRAAALDPSDAFAFATRAEAARRLGRLEVVVADYRRAAQLDPRFQAGFRDAVAALDLPSASVLPRAAVAPAIRLGEAEWGYWRLVFSPVVGALLAFLALCHIGLTRLRPFWTRSRASFTDLTRSVRDARLPAGYRFVRHLGEGGMGVVYEAEDAALGRRVAIKKLREGAKADTRERKRLLNEAKTVAALHHPNIVEIHSVAQEAEELFLVFEFIEGRTLHAEIAQKGALLLPECKRIARAVCEALEFAHARGVVHRDLKPSNVMLSGGDVVKVMDFGIASRTRRGSQEVTRTIAGTPHYMAPEAEQGVVRPESDVYSLGACLYEMATGQKPFIAPVTREAKLRQCYVPPSRRREGLPPALDVVIDWALKPDPEIRVASAAEFRRRLEEIPG